MRALSSDEVVVAVTVALRLAVCGVLVLAGCAKLLSPAAGVAFAQPILRGLPARLWSTLVRFVSLGEIVLGFNVAVGTWFLGSLVVLVTLFSTLVLLTSYHMAHGKAADCGCFGAFEAGAATSQSVTIARQLAMLCATVALAAATVTNAMPDAGVRLALVDPPVLAASGISAAFIVGALLGAARIYVFVEQSGGGE